MRARFCEAVRWLKYLPLVIIHVRGMDTVLAPRFDPVPTIVGIWAVNQDIEANLLSVYVCI